MVIEFILPVPSGLYNKITYMEVKVEFMSVSVKLTLLFDCS